MSISEKKVEQVSYPKILDYFKRVFVGFKVEDFYETADFPDNIKKLLSKASKGVSKSTKIKREGKPDAIFIISKGEKKFMFVFEAKSKGLKKATNESLHYTNFLKGETHNLFRCSIDVDGLKIIHYKTTKELPINSVSQLISTKKDDFINYLEQVQSIQDISSEDKSKEELLSIIRNLNSSLREVGLSGQDRIDFASSLFLVKEIFDLVDEDFKKTHFSGIIHSNKLLTTLNKINDIATLEEIKEIFPDMSHLIIDNQIINMEKFNKVISKNTSETQTKASSSGSSLNERIKSLLTNEVLNLTKTDFDFRGLIVEEFTHGNKGGGVSKEYGEFFTPRHIIKFVVGLSQLEKGDKIFDPAFGTGGFLIEGFKELVKLNDNIIDERLKKYTIYGSELHDWNVKAAKASLIALGDGHSNLINTDFIHGFNDWRIEKEPKVIKEQLKLSIKEIDKDDSLNEEQKEDKINNIKSLNAHFHPNVTLMNPPYSLGGEMSEWHFVKKCFDNVLEQSSIDGIERKLLVVLPYESIEKENTLIHQYSNYIDAYISLPYGVFQKYTDVRTQIIIMKTTPRYTNLSNRKTEPLFISKVEADGFTLDSFRRPIEENDIPKIIEEYERYSEIRNKNRVNLKNIDILNKKLLKKQISKIEYNNGIEKEEDSFFKSYESFKNNEKISILTFNEIKKYNHFDKALWVINTESPTLGEGKPDGTILDYFDIITEKGSFTDEKNEDLPYVEIGGIELLTTFYSNSNKPKCFNKSTKEKGQIIDGILSKKGDVLISMVRTYRGGFTILKEDSIVTKAGFLVLRQKGNISGIELLSILKENLPTLIKYINYLGNGKTYPKMEKDDFVQIRINESSAKSSKDRFHKKLLSQIDEMFEE
jgi:hypothetical protein